MFKMIPLLILASVFAYSCSSSDTKKSEDKPAASSEEVSTEDAFADDGFDDEDFGDEDFGDDTADKELSSSNDKSTASSGSEESFCLCRQWRGR